MNLLFAIQNLSTFPLLNIFIWVAIAAVIVWGIFALVKASGIPIPAPVRIVFIVLVCIFLILLLVKGFEAIL